MSGSGIKRKLSSDDGNVEKKARTSKYAIGDFIVHQHEDVGPKILIIIADDGEDTYLTRELIQDPMNPGIYMTNDKTIATKLTDSSRRVKNILELPETHTQTLSKKRWHDSTADDGSFGLLQLFYYHDIGLLDLSKIPKTYVGKKDVKPEPPEKDEKGNPPAYDSENYNLEILQTGNSQFEYDIPERIADILRDENMEIEYVLQRNHIRLPPTFETLLTSQFNNEPPTLKFPTMDYDARKKIMFTGLHGKIDLTFLDYQGVKLSGDGPNVNTFMMTFRPKVEIELLFNAKKFADKSIFAICLGGNREGEEETHRELVSHVTKCAKTNGYNAIVLGKMIKYGMGTFPRLFAAFRVVELR